MHSLIITPYVLQGSMFANSLKRENIKSFAYSPQSIINQEWQLSTDAIIFPHPFKTNLWIDLIPFLSNLSENIPFILIGKIHRNILKQKQLQKFLKRSIFLDDSLPAHEIPEIIQEIITKNSTRKKSKFKIGTFSLDCSNRLLIKKNKEVQLTRKEFFLLELLMLNTNRVITRDRIINYVWDRSSFVSQNTVDVYISRVRKKLQSKDGKSPIKTIPCLGYSFSL